MSSHDPVNHPKHYNTGSIECIEAIEASMSPLEFKGYLKGTIMKYNTRLGLKGSTEDEIHDAGKMRWYAHVLEDFLKEIKHNE